MNEIWIDSIIHPDLCEVSSLGRVRNKKTNTLRSLPVINSGYVSIVFSKYRSPRNYLLHRLVWESFNHVRLEKKEQINHIDKNKLNNSICNLEKVTQSQNVRHFQKGKRRGAQKHKVGKYEGFVARITINGKITHIKYCKTRHEAQEAYYHKYFEVYGEYPW